MPSFNDEELNSFEFQITPTQSRYPLSVADGRNVAAPRPAFTVGDAGKN